MTSPRELFEWSASFNADVGFEEVIKVDDFNKIDFDLGIWYNPDFVKIATTLSEQDRGLTQQLADPVPVAMRAALQDPTYGVNWFNYIAERVPYTEARCVDYLYQALKHIMLVDHDVSSGTFMLYDPISGVWVRYGDVLRSGEPVGGAIYEILNRFGRALSRASDVLEHIADFAAPDPGPKPAANANQGTKAQWYAMNEKRKKVLERAKKSKDMARSIFTGKYRPIISVLKERMSVSTMSWDSETRWLILADGVLDLEALYHGEAIYLRPFSPRYMSTMALDVRYSDAYNSDAPDSEWDKGVTKVIPDPEVRRYLQKRFGAALLGRPGICGKSMVWQFGVGDTAKSTIQECIAGSRGVFAPYSITASSAALTKNGERTGATDRFKAYARGKRYAIMSELDDGEQLAQGSLKNMIGGESVEGTAKYSNAVTYFFTATIFMASNHEPSFPIGDTAAASRIHVVPFTHKMWIRSKNPKEWEEADPEDRADEQWQHRILSSPTERSSILRWVLDGLMLFGIEGIGELPVAMQEARDEFAAEADPIARIVRSLLGEEPGYEGNAVFKIYGDVEWGNYGFKESDGVTVKDVDYWVKIRAFEMGILKSGDSMSLRWLKSAKRMFHELGGKKKKVRLDNGTTAYAFSRMRLDASHVPMVVGSARI